MRAGKVALDHNFELSGHICRGKACPCPSSMGYNLDDHLASFKYAGEIVNIRRYAARRQTLQEHLSIHFRAQTRIQDSQHSAIGGAANQATETLLQTDN